MNSENTADYKTLITLSVIILCVVIPLFLLSPYLFHDVAFTNILYNYWILSTVSFVIGVWILIVSMHLRKEQRQKATSIVANSGGSEITILYLPYILYLGTKSLIFTLLKKLNFVRK